MSMTRICGSIADIVADPEDSSLMSEENEE